MRRGARAASKVCVLATVLAGASGCQMMQGSKAKIAVRPSSQEELADVRVLEQPFVLAVPEDAIVRVVGPTMTCTGTLIDDDLILTAHHCLVERGPYGEFSKQLIDPASVRIELGGDYFAWGEVGVRHIVAPPCGEGGGAGDVSVLVLKRKLIGMSTMTPRLEAPPRVGEEAYPVGFGRCALSPDAIRRKGRDGGPIRALSGETLHMDASVCPGDSGGPVFAKGSREIIGVVSLSAMDHDETTRGPSVMARLDSYRLVFAHARLVADGLAPNELPPLECTPAGLPPQPREGRGR
ncbi:MAG: S1 family peptidase [Labilithrix sp.]|nr:S1 family peptidase [Labilithrix sp.]MCW5831706.1 S1 family peptidase [Labilithrix sp.]